MDSIPRVSSILVLMAIIKNEKKKGRACIECIVRCVNPFCGKIELSWFHFAIVSIDELKDCKQFLF